MSIKEGLDKMWQGAQEAAHGAAEKAKEVADQAKTQAHTALEHAQEATAVKTAEARDLAHRAQGALADTAHKVKEAVGEGVDELKGGKKPS